MSIAQALEEAKNLMAYYLKMGFPLHKAQHHASGYMVARIMRPPHSVIEEILKAGKEAV